MKAFKLASFKLIDAEWGQGWLTNCSYDPPQTLIGEHFKLPRKNLDLQSSKDDRFVFIGDFNVGMKNEAMKDFCNL